MPTYIEEIELAKNTYYNEIKLAKEVWVNGSDNYNSIILYNNSLAIAEQKYDQAIKLIQAKYLS